MPYAIGDLNAMTEEEFVAALGAIFEETPEIARRTWHQRPFTDRTDLHQKMITVVAGLAQAEQLALIRAHPDLGSRVKMAEASVQEQAGLGLDQLTSEEYDRFQMLNQAYRDKFAFPFIIAVRNNTRATILEAFTRRLQNNPTAEMAQALTEIGEIARFRLFDQVV
ncbi:OHCU decarboxylase [Leptolyngbya sp. 'hensonii']|uniref:2-oxo-4-hydroxy-4-carboxy-5-ureidoimidazoline decarboxylase n=1 Tax=Leptolyngbya sp. 'hensonii' TaxID=1922337 RepID=UPI00094FF53D|nr:2-oxo-4-hydroxy-4-carboxy-5-ureidoimidazoline decarboxylase [Leptolyngbya sp. 'hensonii']OLP20143.1 OHCU decarboxylase [Leptolyngbya sp. 'hensonii']